MKSCFFISSLLLYGWQVLDLQTHIENIVAELNGENVTLKDICFKPLSPDNEECTIQSVLQYWENNKTKLDEVAWDEYHFYVEADYLDHFLACVRYVLVVY